MKYETKYEGLKEMRQPPTALFIAGFVAMIMILLYFSTIITKLTQQNRQAAQQLGLLEWKLHELEKRLSRLPKS